MKKSVKYGIYSIASIAVAIAFGMASNAIMNPSSEDDNIYINSQSVMTTAGVDTLLNEQNTQSEWYNSVVAEATSYLAGVDSEAPELDKNAAEDEKISDEDAKEMDSLLEDDDSDKDLVVKELLYPELEGIAVAKVDNYLKIRKEPNKEAEVVGKLYHATAGKVITEENATEGWTKIISGSVTGYVSNDYILVGDEAGEYVKKNCVQTATVTCSSLRIRKEPTTDSEKLASIKKGDKCTVMKTYEGWLKIMVDNDLAGYVSDEYVEVKYELGNAISIEEEKEAIRKAEEEAKAKAEAEAKAKAEAKKKAEAEAKKKAEAEAKKKAETKKNSTSTSSKTESSSKDSDSSTNTSSSSTSQLRQNIVSYALQFVGNPYVHGGNSLTRGTDCSGFTKLIYKHFGYNIARTPGGQIPYGKKIKRSELRPGDLVFYMNSRGTRVGHVAMYIGNNKVVHASNPSSGIKVSSMNYRSYYCLVNIIGD